MKLARTAIALVCILTALDLGCAPAPTSEEELEATENAITGSPSEEKANRDDAYEKAYLGYFDEAYRNAELDAFTALADGKGLFGHAAADFASLSTSCAAREGFKVRAQRWAAEDIPRPVPGGFSLETRKLFTIDAFDENTKRTLAVAVYDEEGAFLFGRKRSQAGSYTTQRGSEFRRSLLLCT
jgi:hypothetical protein